MNYEQAKAKRRANKNPWLTLAIDRITGGGLEWMQEFTLTVMEYDGADKPARTCPYCGHQMWYRSTVGSIVCPECHALRNCTGDIVRKP